MSFLCFLKNVYICLIFLIGELAIARNRFARSFTATFVGTRDLSDEIASDERESNGALADDYVTRRASARICGHSEKLQAPANIAAFL